VTALPVEYHAVRAHLSDVGEFVTPLGMVGELGTFGEYGGPWRVGVIQIGMGNERAAVETDRAIAALDPEVVIFTGIAGGIKDVRLGDVLVASKVYAYEYGKDAEHFRPRPEALEPSFRILNRASAVARGERWQLRIRPPAEGTVPNPPVAVVKPLAAGSRVVSHTGSASALLLREDFSDAAAVEMEGHGFMRALQAHPERQALIVRGISDLIDGKEVSDAGGWQAVASANAAAFAFEVLAQYVGTASDSPVVQATSGHTGDEYWRDLRSLLVRRYPGGPLDERIWQRAGGDLSRLPVQSSARTAWYDAVSLIERGGGGATVSSLLREVHEDFPEDPEVRRLSTPA
jgi:nucleoside phosphorylase